MNLKEQVLTIVISIIYGSLSYFVFKLNKKVLFNKNVIKTFISNFIFTIDLVLIYFLLLKKINNGILSYYSYICIIIGILFSKCIFNPKKTYKK